MKKIILGLTVASAAFSAMAADGTFTGSNIIDGTRFYIFQTDGITKVGKADGMVQFVYNGAVLGTGAYAFSGSGVFAANTISVPGQAGNTVSITVDCWDNKTAATYEEALVKGSHYSETVSVTLGGFGSPPSTEASLTGFKGGPLIPTPEPSTVALAALGLGGLLFISRRK